MPELGISPIALVDLNVWLALAHDGHVHHLSAIAWFNQTRPASAGFCRVTQIGFFRLLTNRSAMERFVLSQKSAWTCYEKLRADDRVTFLKEPDSLESVWKSLSQSDKSEPRTWTDAYLAGFAIAAEAPFVTFDRGFRNYRRLSLLLLGADAP
jgi:toxin-antitoxin system PIN domain toxin